MSWQQFLTQSSNSAKVPALPTRRDEDWRYVSLQFLKSTEFAPVIAQGATWPAPLLKDAYEILIVNGSLQASKVSYPFLVETIERSKAPSDTFKKWFEAFAALKARTFGVKGMGFTELDVFEEQNSRLWDKALFISLNEDTVLDRPLVIRQMTDSTGGVRAPRIWLSLGKRARAAVVEVFEGLEAESQLSLPVFEIQLAESSHLELTRVSKNASTQARIARARIFQHRHSNFESLSFTMGSKLTRDNLDLHLVGEGATSRLHGLSVAGAEHVIDHHTTVDHVVGHCQTTQLYKSVLAGQARVVFNGRVLIRHNSQKANSDQLNQSLLLSSAAEVDSKPQLEIWADDVKATHGATVGQLSEDEIFYLLSRAISRPQAESMIRQGFTQDLLMQVSNADVREWLLSLQNEADQRLLT
ncbi:MAG: Fe-S cluster assembly protein SufD [Bdellovibrio sp.]|jgi:Fe-S cluster assembly protein SufD